MSCVLASRLRTPITTILNKNMGNADAIVSALRASCENHWVLMLGG